MLDESVISEKKLTKLAKHLQKTYSIQEQEALEIIYEEWDLIECSFADNMKVKDVHKKLIKELNDIYRVA
jgi:hypothetical protein